MWVGRPQTAFDSLARALALLSVSLSDQTMARGGSGRSIALRRALCRFRAAARVAGVHPLLLGADVLRQHQARRRGCADCQRQGGGWGDTARHLDHHVVALVVIVVGVAFVRRGRGEQDTELEPGAGFRASDAAMARVSGLRVHSCAGSTILPSIQPADRDSMGGSSVRTLASQQVQERLMRAGSASSERMSA